MPSPDQTTYRVEQLTLMADSLEGRSRQRDTALAAMEAIDGDSRLGQQLESAGERDVAQMLRYAATLLTQRDTLRSGLNKVFTILRNLDAPLDVRVNQAHDVAQAVLDASFQRVEPQ